MADGDQGSASVPFLPVGRSLPLTYRCLPASRLEGLLHGCDGGPGFSLPDSSSSRRVWRISSRQSRISRSSSSSRRQIRGRVPGIPSAFRHRFILCCGAAFPCRTRRVRRLRARCEPVVPGSAFHGSPGGGTGRHSRRLEDSLPCSRWRSRVRPADGSPMAAMTPARLRNCHAWPRFTCRSPAEKFLQLPVFTGIL